MSLRAPASAKAPMVVREHAASGALPKTSTTTASWWACGCALLVFASATRSSPVARGQRGQRNHHRVVTCRAASWSTATAPLMQQAPESLVATAPCPQTRETASAPVVAVPSEPVHPLVQPSIAPLIGTLQITVEQHPAAGPQQRGRRARFAGGARHRSSRRASTPNMRASRTARRSVGARLSPAPAQPPVLEASFDSSRQRTKVQVGLRNVQRVRSERSREYKTPSASIGLNDKSGVLTATYFEMGNFKDEVPMASNGLAVNYQAA